MLMTLLSASERGRIHRAAVRAFGTSDFTIDRKGNVKYAERIYSFSFETGRFYEITPWRAA
jgi:hypothetical protein